MKTYQKIINKAFIVFIKFYQKFVSPYKGFQCAHRIHSHGISCSAYGLKSFQTYSPNIAFSLTKERLYACSIINKLYSNQKQYNYKHSKQAGFVDCDIGDCNPDCHAISCDGLECSPDFTACGDSLSSIGHTCSEPFKHVNCCIWIPDLDCGSFGSNNNISSSAGQTPINNEQTLSDNKIIINFTLLDEFEEFYIYEHVSHRLFKIFINAVNLTEYGILNNECKYAIEISKEELTNLFNIRS